MAASADRSPARDPFSIAGKFRPPQTRFDVVVVGAGSAGTQAAIEAARGGASVLLVDENPVASDLMGLDAPLFFGQRATAAVTHSGRMLEQVIAANPAFETAFEAGVEVALATTAWGAFANGVNLGALPEPVVGLADATRSWLCGFGKLIVATGARDLALSFRGWDQPGVMGAQALNALLTGYNAFAGRRLVVLGTGALALSTALMALDRGLEVAALVEVREQPQGPADLVARLVDAGVPIFTGHAPARAMGGADGVDRLVLTRTADPFGQTVEVACDTICEAIGVVPAVELFDVLGAALAYDPGRGGHVPVLDTQGRALANVFAVGDCAGVLLGAEGPDYGLDWMRALMSAGDPSVIVCQCEGVTRAALIGVKHPDYLGPVSDGMARRDLASLGVDGPINPDQIKRLTRACMGVCQARRCREQVAMTLAIAAGAPLSEIPLAGYRAPVRPLPLSILADWDEPAEMSAGWDVWFGIPTQWTPYRDIGGVAEASTSASVGASTTPRA